MSGYDFWRGGIQILPSGEEPQTDQDLTPPTSISGGRLEAYPQNYWAEEQLELPECSLHNISQSALSDPALYKEVKTKLSVGCVDVWVVDVSENPKVLLGRRASEYDVLVNWWWPIGGRILNTEAGVVSFEESALLTMQLETGISTESIERIHFLGTGITQFGSELQYLDNNSRVLHEAKLETPFSTVNLNLVAVVKEPVTPKISKNIADYWWVEASDLQEEPGGNLSDYVVDFLDDIFAGTATS